MAANFSAIWLGDGDPQAQMVTMGDLHFVKGQAVSVKADHEFADRIKGNPTFAIDNSKATPVVADEPSDEELEDRQDEGTEKGAIKAQLKAMGIDVKGNPSLDTLRAKLADATK